MRAKRPESTAASNSTCCTPAPQLPRHELALLPVPLEEIGVRICCRPRDKVPVLQRSKLRKSAGRLRCAAFCGCCCCGPTYQHRTVSPLVAGCWLRTVFLDNRLTARGSDTCDTDHCCGRQTARSQAKARRWWQQALHDIFLGHCCLRPSREKSQGLGLVTELTRILV